MQGLVLSASSGRLIVPPRRFTRWAPRQVDSGRLVLGSLRLSENALIRTTPVLEGSIRTCHATVTCGAYKRHLEHQRRRLAKSHLACCISHSPSELGTRQGCPLPNNRHFSLQQSQQCHISIAARTTFSTILSCYHDKSTHGAYTNAGVVHQHASMPCNAALARTARALGGHHCSRPLAECGGGPLGSERLQSRGPDGVWGLLPPEARQGDVSLNG